MTTNAELNGTPEFQFLDRLVFSSLDLIASIGAYKFFLALQRVKIGTNAA